MRDHPDSLKLVVALQFDPVFLEPHFGSAFVSLDVVGLEVQAVVAGRGSFFGLEVCSDVVS